MLVQLKRIYFYISGKRKAQFALLILFAIVTSLFEVLSLGAVMPFIGVLTQPEEVFYSENLQWLISFFNIETPKELIFPITMAFAIAALISGIFRTLLLRFGISLSNFTGTDLSEDIYRKTLHQPYHTHLRRSSSEILSGLTQKVRSVTSVIESFVNVVTSLFLLLAILLTLIYIDPFIAFISFFAFGISYGLIAISTKNILNSNSKIVANLQTKVIQNLQEGLGSIREVLLGSTQDVYTNSYSKKIGSLLKATGDNQFITLFPRFSMETIAMILIAILSYLISLREEGLLNALPALGAMALAAQRLLPLLQLFYANWSNLVGNEIAIKDVLALLDQKLEINSSNSRESISFTKSIKFKNLSFKYPESYDFIFMNADLEIKKGSTIGFVGETGSGKSTGLDILMSLLTPSDGDLFVDDIKIGSHNSQNWKKLISHVPQSIFLIDSSIKDNIIFGIENQIDEEKLEDSLIMSQAKDFVESLPNKVQTLVGESGSRLSGGQRQRIGIARSLYKSSEVLILDEATSALDSKTEEKVMNSLSALRNDLTVLIIAHRITTLSKCDKIFLIENKVFKDMGSYEEFIRTSIGKSFLNSKSTNEE